MEPPSLPAKGVFLLSSEKLFNRNSKVSVAVRRPVACPDGAVDFFVLFVDQHAEMTDPYPPDLEVLPGSTAFQGIGKILGFFHAAVEQRSKIILFPVPHHFRVLQW